VAELKIPKLELSRKEGSEELDTFCDSEQGFEVFREEVRDRYNQMATALELMHKYWPQVVDEAMTGGKSNFFKM
jgi:hypothetical protein